MNALLSVLHVLRSGCAWRLLPADWPPGQNVYYYWRKWRRDGTLERIHAALRDELRIASVGIHSPVQAVWTVNR